jgi:hypothetical protein
MLKWSRKKITIYFEFFYFMWNPRFHPRNPRPRKSSPRFSTSSCPKIYSPERLPWTHPRPRAVFRMHYGQVPYPQPYCLQCSIYFSDQWQNTRKFVINEIDPHPQVSFFEFYFIVLREKDFCQKVRNVVSKKTQSFDIEHIRICLLPISRCY